MKRLVAALLIGACCAACAPDFVDPRLVNYLRVLSVRSEPPEVAPGGTLSLDALVGDPLGDGRPVSFAWAVCIPDPILGLSSCDESNAQPVGFTPEVDFTVPADALDGLSPEEQDRGIDVFVLLVVSAGGEQDQALKRVRVSTTDTPNHNPAFYTFTINDSLDDVVNVQIGHEVDLVGTPTQGSIEMYEDAALGIQPEQMRFNWFMTTGRLGNIISFGDDDGVGRTTFTPTSDEGSTVWVVLRDQRGGTAWVQRDVVSD